MKQSSEVKRQKISPFKKYDFLTILAIFAGFVVAMIIMQAAMGMEMKFITPGNWLNILMQVTVVGVIAMGMTIVMISGGIDLSVGSLVTLTAIFTALAVTKWAVPVPLAILFAILLAVGFELLLGFIISRLEVEPFIITLGGMILFKGIALLLCESREVVMQGQLDFFKTNLIEGAKGTDGLNLTIPIYVVIMIAVTIITWWVLKYTKYGRRIYATGANPSAARLAGINVANIKLSSYAINGLLVGIGAVIALARINVGNSTIGQNLEIDVIAAAVIGGVAMSGGKGNAIGTLIGAILLGAITNGMNILRLPSEWQFVAKGAIIIAAVSAGAISARMAAKANLKKQKTIAEAEIEAGNAAK
ncbi:MAG: ABC transporter permease [Christensenella sp.]